MTINEAKNILRSYLAEILPVKVYKDTHPPVSETNNPERVVVNILTLNGKSNQEGYANVNWFVPDIERTHGTDEIGQVLSQKEPDNRKLLVAENSLNEIFNHGLLLEKNGEKMYCYIDKVEQIPDKLSHFINLKLHLQITNY